LADVERTRQVLREICVGSVVYRDYHSDRFEPHSLLARVFTKGRSYAYEREVRAAFFVEPFVKVDDGMGGYFPDRIDPARPTGFDVSVDLGALTGAIYVAPDRKPRFVACVESLLKRYDLPTICVVPSELMKSPQWAVPAAWRLERARKEAG
jgi:hypothetical protein